MKMDELQSKIFEIFDFMDQKELSLRESLDAEEITKEEFVSSMEQLSEEFNVQMGAIAGEYNEIADSIARSIGYYKGRAETIKKEEKRLYERRTSAENHAERLKNYLQFSMEAVGRPKFKTDLYSFNIQNNPDSVVVDDESKVPAEYWVPQPAKMDKKAMKEFLSTGECADWAHLEHTQSLRIR